MPRTKRKDSVTAVVLLHDTYVKLCDLGFHEEASILSESVSDLIWNDMSLEEQDEANDAIEEMEDEA